MKGTSASTDTDTGAGTGTGAGAGADGGLEGVAYLRGDLALEGDRPVFTPLGGGSVDVGPDFYAPQAVADDGRTLLWGWTWEGSSVTQEQADAQGWAGALTLPRELHLAGDVLISALPEELHALRGMPIEAADGMLEHPAPVRLEASARGGLRLERVAADGSASLVAEAPPGPATLLVDASVVEILPEGAPAATMRVRLEPGESLRVRGEDLDAWELRLPEG